METIRFRIGAVLLSFSLMTTVASAQIIATSVSIVPVTVGGAIQDASVMPGTVQTDSATTHLDNAVAALNKGDKSATTQELKTGIAGLETQAQAQPTSFKDKLLDQASKLKALLPLVSTGALSGGALGKAVSLAKLASGGSQLEGLLSAGSLIGKGSQLTSGLTGISGALSSLGGSTQSTGQSLVSTALGSVSKLNQGGLAAKAAEPVAKTQISGVLDLVKGAL